MVLYLLLEMYVFICPPPFEQTIYSWPLQYVKPNQYQILFVSGLTLIIGPQKTFYFFARKQKLRGTVCFIGGILLVFFKRPFIGMVIETFGFLNLFGYVSLGSLFFSFSFLNKYTKFIVISSLLWLPSCVKYHSLVPPCRYLIFEM